MKQPVYKNMGIMYFTWHHKKKNLSLQREFMLQHEHTSDTSHSFHFLNHPTSK